MNPRSSKRQRSHPSGDPTPTREDEAMTLELRHLASELQVPLTAHVIVTPLRDGLARGEVLCSFRALLRRRSGSHGVLLAPSRSMMASPPWNDGAAIIPSWNGHRRGLRGQPRSKARPALSMGSATSRTP
ncbi:JAB domain-containing protein [Sorangium sp. So ce887]|uniref:JAB domain-containing protein n=1 Tax=Sorangium sp. So ce887 TaxID=3133324 RepID=UPI003F5F0E03